MKKLALIVITALLFIIGCTTQQKKDDIEGVWKMVSAYWFNDSINAIYPQEMEGGQLKSWQDGYVMVAGTVTIDGAELPSYVAATYTLDGNKYQETFIYHDFSMPEGMTLNLILEIHDDTLIQKFPADENWNLDEKFMYEKYVRVE